jgi:pSer/pThr/pTyr-binding forkhead associated (FHA) protein
MSILKKKQSLFRLQYVGEKSSAVDIDLTQNKCLIGGSDKTDIFIDSDKISHYHAMLIIIPGGGLKVIDLESVNGTFVNGEKITQTICFEGDILQFGNLSFQLMEMENESVVKNLDHGVKQIKHSTDEEYSIPKPPDNFKDLSLIDDEYCKLDIEYTDQNNDVLPIEQVNYDIDEFIDTHEELETYNLSKGEKPSNTTNLQLWIVSRNEIVTMENIPFKKGVAKLTGKCQVFNFFDFEEEHIDFSISGDVLTIPKLNGWNLYLDKKQFEETQFDIKTRGNLYYQKEHLQIYISTNNSQNEFKRLPFWMRESEFYKKSSLLFTTVMGLFLLLLLVDITKPTPKKEKKLSIIYKVKPQIKGPKLTEAKSMDPKKSKVIGDQKIKTPKQPVKKSESKKAQVKKKIAKKPTPSKPKTKVRPASKSAKNQVAKKIKMKTYKMNLDPNLSNLFSDSKVLNKIKVANTGHSTASLSDSSPLNSAGKVSIKAEGVGKVGKIGSNTSGKSGSSTGPQGLASKKGFETSYVAPKTVVLGSMDPEILRKILREYLPQFRYCYQQELAFNSEDVKGIVELAFTINKNGHVSRANVNSKGGKFSKNGRNCMAKVLKVIEFPKPKGGGRVDVKQPLNFFSEKNRLK